MTSRFPWTDTLSPGSPDYRPLQKEQCDYMDEIDRQAARDELEGLRRVRFRVQQAISEARRFMDEPDEFVASLEAALSDACIDERIIRLDEVCCNVLDT